MSKIKYTVSRLLALGGLTAASGSTYALYRYSLLGETPTADCRAGLKYGVKENDSFFGKLADWDDNWDARKDYYKKNKDAEPQIPVLDNNTDKAVPTPVTPAVKGPTATRHVILIRHGQYNQSSSNDAERTLTALGRQQALATGERLKALNIKFDKLTVSTMTRAQETADIISKSFPNVPQSECSMLREGAPYPCEPTSSKWRPENHKFFQDNARIEGAFRKYIHRADPSQREDSHELIVCHANVIRYFVCRALQFPPEGWLRMSIGNCGVTWLTIRPSGNVSLRGLGDTGHLPPDHVTFK